jgi:hypothetical protein
MEKAEHGKRRKEVEKSLKDLLVLSFFYYLCSDISIKWDHGEGRERDIASKIC